MERWRFAERGVMFVVKSYNLQRTAIIGPARNTNRRRRLRGCKEEFEAAALLP
jgi:hypothetical protein